MEEACSEWNRKGKKSKKVMERNEKCADFNGIFFRHPRWERRKKKSRIKEIRISRKKGLALLLWLEMKFHEKSEIFFKTQYDDKAEYCLAVNLPAFLNSLQLNLGTCNDFWCFEVLKSLLWNFEILKRVEKEILKPFQFDFPVERKF